MRKKPQIAVLTGLVFAGISYGVVNILGYNSTSYTILAYLYVSLSFILMAFYELDRNPGSIKSILKNFVFVVEEDEKMLKRVFTGEKYKIKGKVEKV